MTTWFVTRHPGAREWAARRGIAIARLVDHLDPAVVAAGDTVIGVLPVALAAAVCARGAHFVNLTLNVPPELRGCELDADTLERLGARLEGFEVWHEPLRPARTGTPAVADVQVGIVSTELLANLIPALHARPSRFIALASHSMQAAGARFAKVLEEKGIACDVREMPEDNGSLRAFAAQLADECATCGELVALNASGGTKPMSIALSAAFGRRELNVFYCDTKRGCLVHLNEDREESLTSVLDIPTALAVQDMRLPQQRGLDPAIGWEEQARSRDVLTRYLGQHAQPLAPLFKACNRHKASTDTPIKFDDASPEQIEALKRLQTDRVLKPGKDGGLCFVDGKAKRYLCGDWLEEYAWLVVNELKPDHVLVNVRVEWTNRDDSGHDNELDLVVVHRNRMLIVECKTGMTGKEPETLEKLDALGRLAAGALSKRLVLTSEAMSPTAKKRARGHRIDVFEGEDIAGFGDWVQQWMAGRAVAPQKAMTTQHTREH